VTAFFHSGQLGDIVYSLPAVRAGGGGDFLVDCGSRWWSHFPGDPVAALAPLLEAQPYVRRARRWSGERPDVNLDGFRDYYQGPGPTHWFLNIAEAHLQAVGLGRDVSPWLSAPRDPRSAGKVVLHRSTRFPSPYFRWSELVGRLRDDEALCVGLPQEHARLQQIAGRRLAYLPTADLLELAGVIAGCRLFVGNQSSPMAVALGLGVDVVQETCPSCPNCLFNRPGFRSHMVF